MVTNYRKKSWGKRNEIAAPEPKPSLLEKLVQYDKTGRRALGERRKEMIHADT
nr:hypothetical protein [Candidatus Njordarchaeota archaeon]